MKKTIRRNISVFLILATLLVSMTGCQLLDALQQNNSNHERNYHTYTLTSTTSHYLFNSSPAEANERFQTSPWIRGHYRSAYEDNNGNLVLVLSDDDITEWKKYIQSDIKQFQTNAEVDGQALEVSIDYKKIVASTNKELYVAAGYDVVYTIVYCGIMQMLNGEDPNEWGVNIIFKDSESGRIVKDVNFPKDGNFSIDDTDWD